MDELAITPIPPDEPLPIPDKPIPGPDEPIPEPDGQTDEALTEYRVEIAITPIPAPDEPTAEALAECWAEIVPALQITPTPGAGGTVVASVDGTAVQITTTCIAMIVAAAVPGLCKALEAWLVARANRKFRLKTGETEVEAPTLEGLQQVLALARNEPRR